VVIPVCLQRRQFPNYTTWEWPWGTAGFPPFPPPAAHGGARHHRLPLRVSFSIPAYSNFNSISKKFRITFTVQIFWNRGSHLI
jgi:hypothetical protein